MAKVTYNWIPLKSMDGKIFDNRDCYIIYNQFLYCEYQDYLKKKNSLLWRIIKLLFNKEPKQPFEFCEEWEGNKP